MRQAVGEGRSVVEDELVRAVLARRVAIHRGLERVVGLPEGQHPLLHLGEGRAGRDLASRSDSSPGASVVSLGVGHRRSLFVCSSRIDCSYEDDVSTAVPPRLPDRPEGRAAPTARRGLSRAHPSGSTEALARRRRPFFRRLTGDGRIIAMLAADLTRSGRLSRSSMKFQAMRWCGPRPPTGTNTNGHIWLSPTARSGRRSSVVGVPGDAALVDPARVVETARSTSIRIVGALTTA